jgi:CheY-like chemotaxis protein
MRIEEKRLLVVDDDDAIRALLFTVLRRRGLKVDTARNGIEATERCARCRYAVMLLDLMMPQMSGYEVLERLERMPPDQRPFVIVLTAGNEPRQLNPDIVAGTVRKPFDIELLLDTVLACMTTLRTVEQNDDCPAADSDVPVVITDKVN